MPWRVAIVVFLLIVVIWFVTSIAAAHDWYGEDCCGGGDCQPAPPGSVSRHPTKDGWVVHKGLVHPMTNYPLRNDHFIPDDRTIAVPSNVPEGIHPCTCGNGSCVRCLYIKRPDG